MPQATRVGLIHRNHPKSIVRCWRCGQPFNFHTEKVIRSAPCADCRDYLKNEEGDTTRWRKPERKA